MPEQLQKNFSIDIQQKLYEQETPNGLVTVYQTATFGLILTLNHHILLSEFDNFFFHEMLVHPAVFTHLSPKKVAIVGSHFGILQEVLKHPEVSEVHCINHHTDIEAAVNQFFPQLSQTNDDTRVKHHTLDSIQWLAQCEAGSFDIIIQAHPLDDMLAENFGHYSRALQDDGIFLHPCLTSLFHHQSLKTVEQKALSAGFTDVQTLNFPQPSFPAGWRTVMMTTKRPTFNRIREKDIFNRGFITRYYNLDVHKAALAIPEFMRE